MKRLIALLLAASMLFGVAMAESCQHEYSYRPYLINEIRRYISEQYPDDADAFYGYALCEFCSNIGFLAEDPTLLEQNSDDSEARYHRMYVLPDLEYTAWKTKTDRMGRPYDELRQYRVAVCIDCNLVAPMHVVLQTADHQFEEKQGFHITGQYIHVTCEECTLCGLMVGELVPCISNEDGSCERTQ